MKKRIVWSLVVLLLACSQKHEATPQSQQQEQQTGQAQPSNDRLYRVGTPGDFHFVRSNGAIVPQAVPFIKVIENSCGEPRPVEDKSYKWGYFTVQGMVIPPQFDAASCFSDDGYAKVTVQGATGIIDKSGAWIVPLQRKVTLISLNEGYLLFARQWDNGASMNSTSTAYGFADASGQIVIPPKLSIGMPFSEGLAGVSVPNAIGIGYINHDHQLVIPYSYGEARPFREGLAAVRPAMLHKFGYIDHTGARPIDVRFDDAMSFNEGLAAVKENSKWGFINKSGEYVIQPTYESVESFYGGLARVSVGGQYFYVDQKGNRVFSG